MRFGFILLLGLVFAAGLGLAAHLIARDTVALPVASIEAGERLAPATVRRAARPRRVRQAATTARTTTTTTRTASTPTGTESGDDHGRGRGRNRGRGGGGSGGGGSGGDDD